VWSDKHLFCTNKHCLGYQSLFRVTHALNRAQEQLIENMRIWYFGAWRSGGSPFKEGRSMFIASSDICNRSHWHITSKGDFFFFFLCVGDAKSSVPRNLKILCLWVTVQSTDGKLLVDCGTVCCNIRGDYKWCERLLKFIGKNRSRHL
jgi:hypothetical protein